MGRRFRGLGLVVGLCCCAMVGGVAAAQELYVVDGGGGFLRFELGTGKVFAAWSLDPVAGLGPLAAAAPTRGGSAGQTPAVPAEADPAVAVGSTHVVVALPGPSPAPSREPNRAAYRLASLALPDLTPTAARWTVPQPLVLPPALLASPVEDRLLVQWRDERAEVTATGSTLVLRTVALKASTLEEVERWVALVPDDAPASPLLDGASFAADGRTLVAPGRVIRFESGTFRAEPTHVAWTTEQQAKLASYSPPVPGSAAPSFVYAPIHAAAGRELVLVRSERPEVAGDLLLVHDPLTGASSPLFEVPRATAALTPDGRRIVVQEVVAPANRAVSLTRTTGKLRVLDADTGRAIASLESPLLAGTLENVRFRCASPDGRTLIFRGAMAEVVVVELGPGKVWTPNVGFSVDFAAQCAFLED